jgi:hypothetical protein
MQSCVDGSPAGSEEQHNDREKVLECGYGTGDGHKKTLSAVRYDAADEHGFNVSA